MLKLPNELDDKKANDIVTKFVSNRLKEIMEDIIINEVAFGLILSGEFDPDDADKNIEDFVDLNALMMDEQFAEAVPMMFLPENYPVDKANKVFFGLYNLLKAKKEYVPELIMEYMLYSIIQSEIGEVDLINDITLEDLEDLDEDDFDDDPEFEGEIFDDDDDEYEDDFDDDDEEYTTVLRIPEPDRSYVKNYYLKEYESEYKGEELEDFVEELLGYYEDLRGYIDSCFWDTDFLLLDDYSEEQLLESEANEMLGIIEPKENKIIEFPFTGKDGKKSNIRAELDIKPWDLEDE